MFSFCFLFILAACGHKGLRSAIVEHTGDTEFKLQWWGPYISEDGGTLRFTQTARRATRVLVCTAMVRSANEQPQSKDLQQGENMLATSRTVFICIIKLVVSV